MKNKKRKISIALALVIVIGTLSSGGGVFADDGIVVHEDPNNIKVIYVDLYSEVRNFIDNIENEKKRELIKTYSSTPTHTTSTMTEGQVTTPIVDQNAIIAEYKKLLELSVEELEKVVNQRIAGAENKAKASAGLKKDGTVFEVK